MDGDARLAAVVQNLDEAGRALPSGELLAQLPWDGEERPPDPARMSAAEFLDRLAATGDGGD